MNHQPKRRPNRKRQLAGVVLIIVFVSYPLSLGPWNYAFGRGWVPVDVYRTGNWCFHPTALVMRCIPAGDGHSLEHHWALWADEWYDRGERERIRLAH